MATQRDERYYRAWLSHRTVSRRGLLRGLLGGGRQVQQQVMDEASRRQAGRPPQALPEALFLQRCNGCGACVSVCPMGIINLQDNRACVQIEYADCDGCLRCTEACSTTALHPSLLVDIGLRPQLAAQCVGRRGEKHCRQCVSACPQQAISFDDASQPHLQDARCNGCGACKLACYHGHISLLPGKDRVFPTEA